MTATDRSVKNAKLDPLARQSAILMVAGALLGLILEKEGRAIGGGESPMPAACNAIPSWQGDGFSDWREEQPAGRSRTITAATTTSDGSVV